MIFINKKNNEDMIMIKNLRELLVLGFAMIVIANGYIWKEMFRSYKEKIMSESLKRVEELSGKDGLAKKQAHIEIEL